MKKALTATTNTTKNARPHQKNAAPKVSIAQKDLTALLQDSRAMKDTTDRVLALLTEMRRQPQQHAAQMPQTNSSPDSDSAGARLGALLAIISGKGAQQLFEDMLSAGHPPSQSKLLALADDYLARNGVRVST
jgi:hypothetical protein